MRSFLFLFLLTISSTVNAQSLPYEMEELYNELSMMPYPEKFELMDKVMAENPGEPWHYWILASIYEIKGDDSLVAVSFEKALELDPDFSAGHGSYARFLRYSEDTSKLALALEHINKAIYLDTTEDYYHIDRGNIYRMQGKYDEAIKEAESVILTIGFYGMESIKLIVQCLYEKGNMEELKNYLLTNDLTVFDGFMDTKFDLLLGDLYLEYGEADKACKCFNYAAEPYVFMDEEVPADISERLNGCE